MTKDPKPGTREMAALQRVRIVDDHTWANSDDPGDDLCAMLTDLRIWSEFRGLDFYVALDRSYDHYLAERGGLKE